ncbi:MAG: Rne/Rng family ribonuclease [Alphaproteobacteria bacterium]
MAKRMLIDATHPEETREVVVTGNRLEEFDFETSTKKQLKGNIYLAKVTRVEPSLQAAFVDFGGNRHGFLAFSEIHPDYYQIPIADRMALLAEEAEHAKDTEDDGVIAAGPSSSPEEGPDDDNGVDTDDDTDDDAEDDVGATGDGPEAADDDDGPALKKGEFEVIGDDDEMEELEAAERRRVRPSNYRYKIQEVIKRRQILLVQVVKEERGNKGAALTTYLSLAGRFCVHMPNTVRGGGISRKISNPSDRKRLKGVLETLDLPDGMAVILRTAAIERNKAEIKRDFDYLVRLWDSMRELTLESIAPAIVYEEANLIKRSIRDLYTKDIDEILVEGEEGYRTAKDFMRLLMPSHARKVKHYRDDAIPLFHRFQVEDQLDAMHSPAVQLKSGGSIVIEATEALVAIDVNSGRATKERNIERTAYKTNMEAVDEIARQLKLRDLAGLIVIDFIDMMESRNQKAVEKRLKEAMGPDRARIQIGRISSFGLLELSRQRLRPSLLEVSTEQCPRCGGTGVVRSTESTALHVLRAIEEEGIRRRSAEISVTVSSQVALYILNQKRSVIAGIEARYNFRILVVADDSLVPPEFHLQRIGPRGDADPAAARPQPVAAGGEEAPAETAQDADTADTPAEADTETTGRRRRRTRRRRRPRPDEDRTATPATADTAANGEDTAAEDTAAEVAATEDQETKEVGEGQEATTRPRRRRGKRGGRRRSGRGRAAAEAETTANGADAPAATDDQPVASETTEATQPAIASDGKDADTKPEPRPRRRRRTAKSPKPAEAEPATGTDGPATDADEPSPAKDRPTSEPEPMAASSPQWSTPIAASNAATNGEDAGEPASSPVADTGKAAETKSPETKLGEQSTRRGWWQRLTDTD